MSPIRFHPVKPAILDVHKKQGLKQQTVKNLSIVSQNLIQMNTPFANWHLFSSAKTLGIQIKAYNQTLGKWMEKCNTLIASTKHQFDIITTQTNFFPK